MLVLRLCSPPFNPSVKLSAKFARQEREPQRVARIARRRIPKDRVAAVRRMLGLAEEEQSPQTIEPSKP